MMVFLNVDASSADGGELRAVLRWIRWAGKRVFPMCFEPSCGWARPLASTQSLPLVSFNDQPEFGKEDEKNPFAARYG